ncbi:unnamed protein product [Musa acuminata subsp. burmannicoides]|uniref:(wild Malaysian banana) hypothetical protein n=1 Tax=Musa acuminata subsp. malaccensis TaxID=214687 RepID=A0A804J3U2_MUSAM|nr:unnamed protein product [Musa acuminata subsp. malaccensis]
MWPSGLRVMVVDNDSRYLGLMERLLLQCNYQVMTCAQVQEAISLVMDNRQSIDLIISDAFLPSDDGLLILKSLALALDFAVIMMSWSEEFGMMMNYIAHGACDFLIKPVKIKELRNIWQHVFGNKWDSGMIRSSSLGKKQKDCILPIREADGVVTDVCDLKKARLQWTTQLHQSIRGSSERSWARQGVAKENFGDHQSPTSNKGANCQSSAEVPTAAEEVEFVDGRGEH